LLLPLLPLLLSSLAVGRAAHAQTPEPAPYAVEDFESPILGSPGYTPYALSGGTSLGSGGWKFQGLCGIAVNGSVWTDPGNGAPSSPHTAEGQQFAYLRSGTENGQQVGSSLYLDVVVPNSKLYMEIRSVQRAGNTSPQVLDIWVDRDAPNGGLHVTPPTTLNPLGGYQPDDVYTEKTFPVYVKPGVSHRIEIVTAAPPNASEDKTAFIDEIVLYANRPPVANPVTVDMDAAGFPVHWAKPVTFNLDFTDPEYPGLDPAPISAAGAALGSVKPSHGTVRFSYDRAVYTPVLKPGEDPLSLSFTDTFTYTVNDITDVSAKSNEARVTVNIRPDRAPTLSAAGAALPVDAATGLSNIDVNLKSTATGINIFPLPYWTDPDGDAVIVADDSVGKNKKPVYGTATKMNNTAVTYITFTITQSKQAGLNGKRPPIGTSDTFDYAIIDGNGGRATGLITVHYVQ
jgi:hypothetical protein